MKNGCWEVNIHLSTTNVFTTCSLAWITKIDIDTSWRYRKLNRSFDSVNTFDSSRKRERIYDLY